MHLIISWYLQFNFRKSKLQILMRDCVFDPQQKSWFVLQTFSLWSADNEVLQHSKWRFVTTVFGAWAGAVVIPLDWDRPWQKWPIPCLSSVTFAFLISNVVLTIHLFCSIFGIYLKLHMISTESNKIKNF